MRKSRTVRVIILGDSEVGKTTFISTIISEVSYSTQRILNPVVLPPNMCFSENDVYTELVDSHSSRTNLRESIPKMDIVLLMYDVTNEETIERISKYWLPVISGIDSNIPVVIAGNKIDKIEMGIRDNLDYKPLKEVIKPILREFKQVQMGFECSAYYNRNVNKVLHCLQSAVLHPVGPLYSLKDRDLTQRFKKILTRVFRVLDQDFDGELSDVEISKLQERVFDSSLNADHIKRIKEIIKIELEEYDHMNKISLKGFIALNKKCIEMKNMQICWSILHNFGYDEQLELIPAADRLVLSENSGASIELKDTPREFLMKIFQQFQEQFEGEQTSNKLLTSIFYPVDHMPILEFEDPNAKVNLEEFLVAWSYLANKDYVECYETLLGIGYEGSMGDTFEVTESKISFNNMCSIHNRSTIYVAILDSGQEQKQYVGSFFVKSVVENGVQRCYTIHSLQNSSKILILFRLKPGNIREFFNFPGRSKLIDIVVYFQKGWADKGDLLKRIPDNIMRKVITQTQLNQQLVNDLSEIDLNRFPVEYKKSNLTKMINLIWRVVQHPEEGYSQQKVKELQKLNRSKWADFSGVALLSTLAVTGGLLAVKLFARK